MFRSLFFKKQICKALNAALVAYNYLIRRRVY